MKRRMYRLIPTKPLVPSIDTTTLGEGPGLIARGTSPPFQSTSYVEDKVGKWWFDTGSYPSLRNYDGVSWAGILKAWILEVGDYLQVGTGTVDVDLTGIYIDRSKFQAQNAGTDQVWIDITDGKFYAGAGAVTLDVDGITFDATTVLQNEAACNWKVDGVPMGQVYTLYVGTSPNRGGYVVINAYKEGTGKRVINLSTETYNFYLDENVGGGVLSAPFLLLSQDLSALQFVDSNTEIWEDASSNLSFKDAIAGILTLADLSNKKMVMGAPTELTIFNGVITVTQSNHIVDTEGDAATDDLDTINGGVDGMILCLQTVANLRDVTVKDGTGNIKLAGSDFVLANQRCQIVLKYHSEVTAWVEWLRAANS